MKYLMHQRGKIDCLPHILSTGKLNTGSAGPATAHICFREFRRSSTF